MMGKVPWWICIFWWCAIAAAVDNWVAYWAIVGFWLFLVPAPLWWVTRKTKFLNFYERFIMQRVLHIVLKKGVDVNTVHEEYDDGDRVTFIQMVKRKY